MKKDLWFFPILFSILLVLFWPLFLYHTPINPDYDIVIRPLLTYSSLLEYLQDLFNLKTIDVQPIRDFSHFIDTYLVTKFHLWFFQTHNLIIWFVTVIVIYKILLELQIEKTSARFGVLLLAIHPTLLQSVFLAVGRKHLLSFFFIMVATWFVIKDKGVACETSY
jgi:hypothetical protein